MSLSIPPVTLIAVFFILLFTFSSVFVLVKIYNTLMSVPRIECILEHKNISSSEDDFLILIEHKGGSSGVRFVKIVLNGKDTLIVDSFNTTTTIKGYNVTITIIGSKGYEILPGNKVTVNITIEPSLFYNNTASSGILIDLEKTTCVVKIS